MALFTPHAPLSWGTITLLLDQEELYHGFELGRSFYFEDLHGDHPELASRITSADIDRTLLVCGHGDTPPHFDEEELDHPRETLGILLGYLSGPLYPETSEETEARLKAVLEHPEVGE